MAICSVLTASPAGRHTANGTFEPLTHVLPPLWHPAQELTAVKTGCLADTACHFAAPEGKPVAFQLWFQLSEEKGLSSASRPAPQISLLLRRESSQCPTQFLSSNRAEALVPSTGASKLQQDFLMHLFLCPVPSFSVCIPVQKLGAAWWICSILSTSPSRWPALCLGSRPCWRLSASGGISLLEKPDPEELPLSVFARDAVCQASAVLRHIYLTSR